MKVIELQEAQPTLDEVIGLAKDELVVLRKADGSVFALSHVDDFDLEVELQRNNPESRRKRRFLWRTSETSSAFNSLDRTRATVTCAGDSR
jgi:hypothetical protein